MSGLNQAHNMEIIAQGVEKSPVLRVGDGDPRHLLGKRQLHTWAAYVRSLLYERTRAMLNIIQYIQSGPIFTEVALGLPHHDQTFHFPMKYESKTVQIAAGTSDSDHIVTRPQRHHTAVGLKMPLLPIQVSNIGRILPRTLLFPKTFVRDASRGATCRGQDHPPATWAP